MSSKVMSLAAMLPAAMLASAEIVSVPLTAQEGVVGKSKNAGSYYSIDIAVGTPGQNVPVKFDTGSSELWVNPECDKSSNPAACAALGRFTESTTIDVLEGETGTLGPAEVQYATDYVRIGSATITQQVFGLGQKSKDAVVGVFGAGPQASGFDSAYPLAIDSLVSQELIGSRAFALDLKGPQGSVLFGGVDTQKYAGHLSKLPVVPGPNGEAGWFVKLDEISIKKADGLTKVYSGPGQTVLLDSGSSLSTLPPPIFAALLEAFPNAQLDAATGLHSVDCSSSTGSIDFTFGDKVISVPVSDFVVNVPGSGLCLLGAFEGPSAVLGDTFLKSAYAVFDFDGKAVHIAQAAHCGSNVVSTESGIPSVEGCGASLARRFAKKTEPEPTPEEELEWCDEEDEEEDDDEWCEEDDEDFPPTRPTNTRGPGGNGGQPTGGSGGHPTGGSGGHPTGGNGQPTGGHGGNGGHPGPRPTGAPGGGPRQTLTRTQFSTFTVTSCAPTVTNCHAGNVVTAVITQTTEVCPETTAVYTRHQGGKDHPFTITPVAPRPTPVPVPGCGVAPGAPGGGAPSSGSGSWTPGSGSGAPGAGAPGSGSGSWTPGSGSGAPGAGAPGSGSGSWAPGSGSGAPGAGSGAPGSGSGSWAPGSGAPEGGAPGSGSGSWAPGSGAPEGGAPGSGSGSWGPGSGAPGSGSGAPESGHPGSGAPGSGAPSTGSGAGAAPGTGSGHGAGHGAGAGSPTTLVAVHPTGGAPSYGGHAGGNGTAAGYKPVVMAGASRTSWTVAALVGAVIAGVMAL